MVISLAESSSCIGSLIFAKTVRRPGLFLFRNPKFVISWMFVTVALQQEGCTYCRYTTFISFQCNIC